MTPSADEVTRALADVNEYGHLKYPVGEDRAALCHAAIVLAEALRESWRELRLVRHAKIEYCHRCTEEHGDGRKCECGGNR